MYSKPVDEGAGGKSTRDARLGGKSNKYSKDLLYSNFA